MRFNPASAVLGLAVMALSACNSGEAPPVKVPVGKGEPAATPAPPPPEPLVPVGPANFVMTGESTQGGWMRGTAPGGTVSLTFNGTAIPVARDGSFIVAFDRDAGPTATLVARLSDGRERVQSLAVSPRAWAIERVNIPRSPGGATEAFMVKRRPELERIAAARRIDSDSQGWRQQFIWPVKGRLSGQFGSQRIYRGGEPGAYHSGTDIATGASGTPFATPADGVVILAAETPFTLEGHLLMIDHGMGLNSAFLHCSELLVKEGDRVRRGQIVGRIGATGRATGPHLHWSMKWRDARLDPILFTGPMR
jgi:murein DD-endopeptidase MepM/ murein hydrolase activator NlpD